MVRTPEQCPLRETLRLETGAETFVCSLVGQITGLQEKWRSEVRPDACEACCRFTLPSASQANPVVASLAYEAASAVLEEGKASAGQMQEAAQTRQYAIGRLAVAAGRSPPTSATARPPTYPEKPHVVPVPDPPAGTSSGLTWAAGLLTAPRPKPTIRHTFQSLQDAGFKSVHVFAEPGSWIPEELRCLPITVHGRPLGNLGNFLTSLATLFVMHPNADCYAIFEDDIEVARGLRPWCDRQFWPQDTGLVSLFTSRIYSDDRMGWRILKLGFYRTFGALALVFRRDVLQEFLTDGRAFQFRAVRRHGSDAVLGEWATRRGTGIAYHTPSLVQHIGATSAIAEEGHGFGRAAVADAVASVQGLTVWTPPAREPGKIGLVGWNTASGLGYQNRDIAAHLPIHKWLVPEHSEYPALPRPRLRCSVDRVPRNMVPDDLKGWLRGLDWVLFVELPYIDRIAQHARAQDVSVACVPNWEWTNLKLDWVNYVDLMICPTRHTYELISDWKRRFGFAWDVVHVPWPVDSKRFPFRRREKCRRFLFINGTGGCRGRRPDGSLTDYRRKGCEVLFEAASMVPEIPLIVYSQIHDVPHAPANVDVRKGPRRNEHLYREGDVCVQPSHWEGLGLQFLECQAAGLPLVTTDSPPMNEYQPLRAVPVAETEIVSVHGNHPLTSNKLDPADLAATLEGLFESDISAASENARRFAVREHSWERAAKLLCQRMLK